MPPRSATPARGRAGLGVLACGLLAVVLLTLAAPAAGQAPDGRPPGGAVQSWTFGCNNQNQAFVVPAGVANLIVDLRGGQGGTREHGGPGGMGARVRGTLAVTPGQILTILVGCGGNNGSYGFGPGGAGGKAQPGNGSLYGYDGMAGGGASAVLTNGSTMAVAGGGGGGGGNSRFLEPNYGEGPGGAGGSGSADPGDGGGGACPSGAPPYYCQDGEGGAGGGASGSAGSNGGSWEAGEIGGPGGGGGGGGGRPGGSGGGGGDADQGGGGGGAGGSYAAAAVLSPIITAATQGGDGAVILTAGVSGGRVYPCSGAPAPFVVPSGVTQLTVEAHGGRGGTPGGTADWSSGTGGAAGMVTGTVPVTPAQALTVFAGCGGDSAQSARYGASTGGDRGDGPNTFAKDGHNGGGSSEVWDRASSRRLIVAGGGGGGGGAGLNGGGGNGGLGGLVPRNGESGDGPGNGGGGCNGESGNGSCSWTNFNGGDGEDASWLSGGGGGGGGAGGYVAGSGGGSGSAGGGGGGGGAGGVSRAADGVTDVTYATSPRPVDGIVILTWRVTPPPTPTPTPTRTATPSGPRPTVTNVTPNLGSATVATPVTITGTGFSTVPGATQFGEGGGGVSFANVVCRSSTVCTATAPPRTSIPGYLYGFFPVIATVNGQSSSIQTNAIFYYYGAPILTGITPSSGSAGTTVTLTGQGFPSAAQGWPGTVNVLFGSQPATAVTCPTTTTCTATVPPGYWTVTVTVTTAGGTSGGLSFSYPWFGATPPATTPSRTPTQPATRTPRPCTSEDCRTPAAIPPVPETSLLRINNTLNSRATARIACQGREIYVIPLAANATAILALPTAVRPSRPCTLTVTVGGVASNPFAIHGGETATIVPAQTSPGGFEIMLSTTP